MTCMYGYTTHLYKVGHAVLARVWSDTCGTACHTAATGYIQFRMRTTNLCVIVDKDVMLYMSM